MPTTKPRYTVTDTGRLSSILDDAQGRWPDTTDRKELLLRLAAEGHEVLLREREGRMAAVRETAGMLSGVYTTGELQRLRDDWPD